MGPIWSTQGERQGQKNGDKDLLQNKSVLEVIEAALQTECDRLEKQNTEQQEQQQKQEDKQLQQQEFDRKAALQQLQVLRGDFEQVRVRVFVLGAVHSGKSALINALLGAQLLPTGLHTCTRRPYILRHRDIAEVHIQVQSQASSEIQPQNEQKNFTGIPEAQLYLSKLNYDSATNDQNLTSPVIIELRCEALREYPSKLSEKIEIYDFPGFVESTEENSLLNKQLENLQQLVDKRQKYEFDLFVWARDCQLPENSAERHLFAQVCKVLRLRRTENDIIQQEIQSSPSKADDSGGVQQESLLLSSIRQRQFEQSLVKSMTNNQSEKLQAPKQAVDEEQEEGTEQEQLRCGKILRQLLVVVTKCDLLKNSEGGNTDIIQNQVARAYGFDSRAFSFLRANLFAVSAQRAMQQRILYAGTAAQQKQLCENFARDEPFFKFFTAEDCKKFLFQHLRAAATIQSDELFIATQIPLLEKRALAALTQQLLHACLQRVQNLQLTSTSLDLYSLVQTPLQTIQTLHLLLQELQKKRLFLIRGYKSKSNSLALSFGAQIKTLIDTFANELRSTVTVIKNIQIKIDTLFEAIISKLNALIAILEGDIEEDRKSLLSNFIPNSKIRLAIELLSLHSAKARQKLLIEYTMGALNVFLARNFGLHVIVRTSFALALQSGILVAVNAPAALFCGFTVLAIVSAVARHKNQQTMSPESKDSLLRSLDSLSVQLDVHVQLINSTNQLAHSCMLRKGEKLVAKMLRCSER